MAPITKGRVPPHTQAELDFEVSNWVTARKRFENKHKNDRRSTDQLQLQEFLKSRAGGEEVKSVCLELQKKADNMYHSGFGTILENIDTLMAVGDLAIKSAPESIGLAWTGIRMCLHAVQGDWSTFQLFSGACTDIIGIMISCRVYGKMYGEQNEDNNIEEFQELHAKVVDYISDIYTDILEFSFQVRKYTDKHIVIRIGKNIFKDTRGQFEGMIKGIKASDETMRDFARTASDRMTIHLQKRSIKGQDEMRSELASLKGILEATLKTNEAVVRRAFEELEEERKTMRKKTPYEKAQDEFEENMNYLDPTADQYELLRENVDVKREPGTCQWILKDEEYTKWHKSDESSMIWISGGGGYGKSILMSTVIETLRTEATNSEEKVVQYFFCKAGSDATQSTAQILRTVVAQLYTHSLALPDLLEQTNEIVGHGFNKSNDKSRAEASFDFVTVYSGLLRIMNREVFLVIDAIDECIDRQEKNLLKALKRVAQISEAKIKIMLCSRPKPDIGNGLSNLVEIKCEGRNTEDIFKNVTSEMRKFPSWTASERADAVKAITKKSGGQFRYVQIALDFLRKPLVRPYSRELKVLPDSLTGSYTASWNTTDRKYVELLKTALIWTLFADGPVTVPEIMDSYSRAYSDDAGVDAALEDYQLGDGEVNLHDHQIRIAGGNFLEVSGSRIVTLRHLTVRDFFVPRDDISAMDNVSGSNEQEDTPRGAWTISEKEGHLEMARMLVQNLASPVFQQKYLSPRAPEKPVSIPDNDTRRVLFTSMTSLQRAHSDAEADFSDPDDDDDDSDDSNNSDKSEDKIENELQNQEYDFSDFDGDESLWTSWWKSYHPLPRVEPEDEDDEDLEDRLLQSTDPKLRYEIMHWTYHLSEAQKLWSWEEQQSNTSWKAVWKSLIKFMCEDTAAFEWWQEIVLRNVDQVAQEEAPSSSSSDEYGSPLQIAAVFNLTFLAKTLIEHGHKVTNRKMFKSFRYRESSPELGDLIAEFTLGDRFDMTPLEIAFQNQHVDQEMVKLCLENGCDVNEQLMGLSPLDMALWNGPSYEFVKYLVDQGAKANNEDNDNFAMYCFSKSGEDPRILQLLLDAGADINKKPFLTEESPLLILVARDNPPVQLLRAYLEAGANVNVEKWDSERPLIDLVRRGNYEAVKEFIRLGADVHDVDDQGRTAMHWVGKCGNAQTLDVLLANHAKANLLDNRERTPLIYACQFNNDEISKSLLEYFVDQPAHEVNRKDFRNRTPLRQAAAHGNTGIVEAILQMPDAAASVNLCDSQLGQNSLHKAAHNGHVATLQLLLAHGGDLTITDKRGFTPFDLCLRAWTENKLKSKLELKPLEDTLVFLASQTKEAESQQKKDLLFRAVLKGSSRIVQSLLDGGLNANIKDAYGWTPMMLAEQWHQYTIIDVLRTSSRGDGPSRWMLSADTMNVSDDGLQARILPWQHNSLTMVSDLPIAATNSRYYFEVEVKALFEHSSLSVGVTSLPAKLQDGELGNRTSGSKSCGWRGTDGSLVGRGRTSKGYTFFGSGDTIGCAVDLKEQTVFYTKNGERFGIAFTGVFGRLHPAITAVPGKRSGENPPLIALVRANFGENLIDTPWKWEGWRAWYKAK